MSDQLINRSPDLKQLRNEGYHVEIRSQHLLLHDIPYVNSKGEVKRGTLVSVLDLAGQKTTTPSTHVALFQGDQPCHKDGSVIEEIRHQSRQKRLANDLVVDRSFSNKPSGGYENYHHKMSTYAAIIAGPAEALDPNATPRTFPVLESNEEESVFKYRDTASSRAGIGALSQKLELSKVAIVGLGGTGSYILDLVSKTPVSEIHLFDGDKFSQHNAFRAPGAAPMSSLEEEPQKVDYLREVYSAIHRGVVAHDTYIDEANSEALQEMDFVFLSLDKSNVKKELIKRLEEFGVPFVDVGMGINIDGDSLGGTVRTTASTEDRRDHVEERIPLDDGAADDAYSQNIQIADLNALNASLAVIRWKKLFGFYSDLEGEHHSAYMINGNEIINDERS